MCKAESIMQRFIGRPIRAQVTAVLIVAGALGAASFASDPVRNCDPEVPADPPDTVHPIFFPLPAGSVVATEMTAPEALLAQFMERHTALDYAAAAEAAYRLVAAAPDRPQSHYNLACVLSKLHRTDEALATLAKAVEYGWRNLAHTQMDSDLANLRGDRRFAQLMKDIQARSEAEQIAPAPLRQDSWETIVAELNGRIPALLERYHVPGATVALVHEGEMVWSAAFGVQDRITKKPLRADHRFRVRAPLHLLTVLACERLQQQRKIQLVELLQQATEQDFLACQPEMRVVGGKPARPGGRRPDGQVTPVGLDQGGSKVEEGKAKFQQRPNSFSRRSVYGFLRTAVEVASERSFPAYCAAELLGPMGMPASSFQAPPDEADAVAVGHSLLGTPLRPNPVSDEFAPGAALFTTAEDLGLLIAEMLNTTNGQMAGTPTISFGVQLFTEAEREYPGGMGLALDGSESASGAARIQVLDANAGILCLMRWHPAQQSGVVVLCNSATGRDAAERIAHLALGGE